MNWGGIARSRWRLLRNTLLGARRGGKSRPSRPLIATVLGLVLCAIIFMIISTAFSALADAGSDARASGVLLGLILGGALVGMILFDLHEAVSAVVAESDLQFLRAAPIRPAALFAIKLLDALPRTSAVMVTLAVPAVAAYAWAYPLAGWAWVVLMPALFVLWLVPLALGAALALPLLRAVPARMAREAMRLLTTLVMLVLWLANSFLLPKAADQAHDAMAWLADATREPPLVYRMSPGSWVAAIATAGAESRPAQVLAPAGALLLTAAGVVALAASTASVKLAAVQARLAAGGRRRARAAPRTRPAARRGGFVGAMLGRDALMLRRDWTVLADVLVTSVLWTLLPLVASPARQMTHPLVLRAMLFALSVALGYEVGARALPFERRGLAWARLAPVSPLQWAMVRWLSAVAISIPIATIVSLVAGRAYGLPFAESLVALGEVLPALVLAISIGIWTGATHGNPDWTHPRAMLTLPGRMVAIALMLAQGFGWIAWSWQGRPGGALAPALAGAISLLALYASAQALRKRVVA